MRAEDEEPTQGSQGWGHCIHCRFFGEEGASGRTANQDERHCHQSELEKFELVVTQSSGCNHFEKAAGLAPTVEEPANAPTFH